MLHQAVGQTVSAKSARQTSDHAPPQTADPTSATEESLKRWGFPARPQEPHDASDRPKYLQKMALWEQTVTSMLHKRIGEPVAIQCTENLADFKGPPDEYTTCGVTRDRQHLAPRNTIIPYDAKPDEPWGGVNPVPALYPGAAKQPIPPHSSNA